MRKLFVTLALVVGLGSMTAADNTRKFEIESDIGPTFATGLVGTTVLTIAAPGTTGKKNCLEYMTWQSTVSMTINVLDGQTTNYQLVLTTTTPGFSNGGVFDKTFEEPFCGTANTAMTFKSTGTVVGAFTTINYKGFVGR